MNPRPLRALRAPLRVPRPWSGLRKAALALVPLMLLPALSMTSASAAAATLATDKADYHPNETVHLTGTGYTPGASYDVPVRRPDGTIVKGDGSFAPGWDTVVADSSGNLAYDYILDGIFGLYEARTYPASWSGNWSETPIAQVTFTDADVNLDQCANDEPGTPPCAWQNGNLNGNNSAYAEGDVVPFRLAIERLDPGNHEIDLNYDFTAGGHKAYDFLATYDATEDVDLCAPGGGGVSSLCPALPTPIIVPFPVDNFEANGQTVAGAQTDSPVTKNLYVFGADSVTVSDVTHSGPVDGNSFGEITVSFTTSEATNPDGQVLLAWGGHLASSAYWIQDGNPDGAGQINGAPWHMRTQDLDGDANKNQDRSIQPSALVVTQSITVVKNTVPDGPQNFEFDPSALVNGNANFFLDDDADPTLPNQTTFTVPAGTHTVTELPVNGFDLTGIVCVDPSGGSAGVGATATFDVAPGEDVTCTFTNTQRGSVTVVKDTVPDGPDDFTFDPSPGIAGANFVLDDDGPAGSATPNTMSFVVAPGIHTVTELPSGADLGSIICVDPTADSSGVDRTATFDVAPGENVTCTFSNIRRGTVTIVKDTQPDSARDFTYNPGAGVNGGASFILDDDGPAGSPVPNTLQFVVIPGTHTVTEAAAAGYTLSSIVCDDNDSTGNTATRTATFRVAPGENVHCTFTNQLQYGHDPGDTSIDDPYGADPGDTTATNVYAPANPDGVVSGDPGSPGGAVNTVVDTVVSANPVADTGPAADPSDVLGENVAAEPAPSGGLPGPMGGLLPRTGAGALGGTLLLAFGLLLTGLLTRVAARRRSLSS